MNMAILAKCSFVAAGPVLTKDPVEARRSKLVAKLEEQIKVAEAALEGKQYFTQRHTWKETSEDTKTKITKDVLVRSWFYEEMSGWVITVKWGSQSLELAKGKKAISIAGKDKLIETINLLIQACKAGELDASIAAVATKAMASQMAPMRVSGSAK
jgi:hypothetical protein